MVQYVRSVDFCGTFYLRLAGALCAGRAAGLLLVLNRDGKNLFINISTALRKMITLLMGKNY